MKEIRPLVTIGMPVYNEERYLKQALEALLNQSFEDFELIISDNASTDHTGEICREYAAKDRRIRYYRTETNLGSIANGNRIIELSNAKYFFIASGHDMRHETFISRCVEVMENDASVVLCYPMARWLDSNSKLGEIIYAHIDTRGLSQVSACNMILWGLCYGYPMYGIMRTGALKKTGLVGKIIGPDIALLIKLSFLGKFAQVSEPLLYMRKLSDYGDWEQYALKCLGPVSSMRSALYLYCKWIYILICVVSKQGKDFRTKVVLVLSVIFGTTVKYGGMLGGLRRIRKKNRKRH